ncbi:MAG: hypothetical protein ACREOK_13655 [Gemmatimonadaceae bacterium]
MNMRYHVRRLLFVPFALAAACSSGTEPGVRDVFVLQSIAGETLPALEHVNAACGVILVADTIVLFEDGTATRSTARDIPSYSGAVDPLTCEPAASSPRKRRLTRQAFLYNLDANVISFDFPCNDTASCVPPSVTGGTLSDTGLIIDMSHIARTPMVYVALAREGLE